MFCLWGRYKGNCDDYADMQIAAALSSDYGVKSIGAIGYWYDNFPTQS